MKKIILLLTLLLLATPVFSAPYKFDSPTMKFVITESTTKIEKKAEKLMQKASSAKKSSKKIKYYEKILKTSPDYLPAIYELTFLHANQDNAQQVLNYATKLRELNLDNTIPSDMITDIIARSNLKLHNYINAANEFEKITDQNLLKRNYTILASTYFKLHEYDKTIKYALKVPSQDFNYYEANELLYSSYLKKDDTINALKYAKNLINLNPNEPQNFIRAAFCCKNNKSQKLDFLYRAKRLLLNQPNEQIYIIDSMIAEIEQEKIEKAYNKLTDFVVKPDWKVIFIDNSPNITFYVKNWSTRQDEFFKTANNCISKYNGANLAKCFDALNISEEKKTADIKEQIKELKEIQRQREQELMMRRMMQMQQQMLYYSRYNYYYSPYRFYRPYYYW